MNAAFGFLLSFPAARARVFVLAHACGAGHAADGGEPFCDKRVARQFVLGDVGSDIVSGPSGQRVDLDLAGVFFKVRDVGACARLEPLTASDPAAEIRQRVFQRFDFAQVAAGVCVRLMQQTIDVVFEDRVALWRDDADVSEVKLLRYILLILRGFIKEHFGVDEDHRGVFVDLRDHMQEHDTFRAKAGNNGCGADVQVIERVAQDGLCVGFAVQ